MKILVTGADGFVGKNLTAELRSRGHEIYYYELDCDHELLREYIRDCGFVFHLAGVNRSVDEGAFDVGNRGFTADLLALLRQHGNGCPVAVSSSIQAERDNPYGRSKRGAEEEAFAHAAKCGARVLVYRLPNLFGKWCRPNYNSAVATFCHNIARGLDIALNPDNPELTLCYIDDLLDEFMLALEGREHRGEDGFCYVPVTYQVRLFEIANLLWGFKRSRELLEIPDMADGFIRKLYSTYLSYLPPDQFSYGLKMNVDNRGSFTEFVRTPERGQVSVNISRPGITKGNHWHHSKNEKFLVVCGRGVIRFRQVGSDEVFEYFVSGERLEVVDIPCGYTHNIENLGDCDMVTIMWANEPFDPERADTYFLEV